MSWVEDLITVLQEALKDDKKISFKRPTGEEIYVVIRKEMVELLIQNRHRLIQVGKQTFQEYLILKSEGADFEALVAIYDRIDNVELVEKAKENALRLAEVAKQIQATRRFWVELGKKVTVKVAMGLLSVVLI
jgi:hypothetical protein